MFQYARQHHQNNGFTIVELVVAMTLFTAMVATFVSLVTTIQYSQRTIQYLDIARNAAVAQMEKMRSEPNKLVDGQKGFSGALPEGLPDGATGITRVSPSPQAADMKNIEVVVSFVYPAGGESRSVELNSTIGTAGIAN